MTQRPLSMPTRPVSPRGMTADTDSPVGFCGCKFPLHVSQQRSLWLHFPNCNWKITTTPTSQDDWQDKMRSQLKSLVRRLPHNKHWENVCQNICSFQGCPERPVGSWTGMTTLQLLLFGWALNVGTQDTPMGQVVWPSFQRWKGSFRGGFRYSSELFSS